MNIVKIGLMNYEDEVIKTVEVDLDTVLRMFIEVVTGDEILNIIHPDGDMEKHYSDYASVQYYDGEVDLYWPARGINRLELFAKRKRVYDFLYDRIEEESNEEYPTAYEDEG